MALEEPSGMPIGPAASPMDKTIADCSRLLLHRFPSGNAVPQAMAHLARAFSAPHAVLFEITSYHAEDRRGQWAACSSSQECPYCLEVRQWDWLRLVQSEVRSRLKEGRCSVLDVALLPSDLKPAFTDRGIHDLLLIPITIRGRWWGSVCIEIAQTDDASTSAGEADLQTLATLFSVHYERLQTAEYGQERTRLSGALEMAGTVCHKLNQPMQVILGYASMVTSGDVEDPDQVKEIVKLIEDETRQMGIMTKNLMGITKNRSTG